MNKDLYISWVENTESWELIQLANLWGNLTVNYATIGGDQISKLQTFEQYLIDYYNGNVANACYEDDGDAQYDDLKQDGLL